MNGLATVAPAAAGAALIDPIHDLATLMLCGLIWTIQLVTYPGFANVGAADGVGFADYHRAYTGRIARLVVPLMVLELVTAVERVLGRVEPSPQAVVGLALVVLIWLSTALLQVPLHGRLERGFDASAARRLVQTNWIRTVAWSLRAALVMAGGLAVS